MAILLAASALAMLRRGGGGHDVGDLPVGVRQRKPLIRGHRAPALPGPRRRAISSETTR